MLGEDYQRRLGSLMEETPSRIELPAGYEDFFDESGPTQVLASDRRSTVRTRVRTSGILIPDGWLPALPRRRSPSTIYTKDFSKTGFGFVADQQYFPGEQVRILLATFWMEIMICRCRRLGRMCFEAGGTLLKRHDPTQDAFNDISLEAHTAR